METTRRAFVDLVLPCVLTEPISSTALTFDSSMMEHSAGLRARHPGQAGNRELNSSICTPNYEVFKGQKKFILLFKWWQELNSQKILYADGQCSKGAGNQFSCIYLHCSLLSHISVLVSFFITRLFFSNFFCICFFALFPSFLELLFYVKPWFSFHHNLIFLNFLHIYPQELCT